MVARWSVAAAVPILLACGSVANAQTCVGQPSLSESHLNVGANMRNVSQGRGFEGRAGFGSARAFGSATLGTIAYDKGTEMRSYIASIAGGLAKRLGGTGSICPMVAIEYENGPDNFVVGQADVSGFVGLSVGGVARVSETVGFVAFVSGGYQSIRSTSKLFDEPESRSYTDNGPAGAGGIGLLFTQRHLIRASLHVPAGSIFSDEDGLRPVYFTLGYSFSPSGAR